MPKNCPVAKVGVGGVPDCFGCPVPHICEKIGNIQIIGLAESEGIEIPNSGLADSRGGGFLPWPFLF
ncbi:MAG: hypothetical protein FJZ04_00800 [Candidatus Moranbacteria bacterium]|nr:hypothetical protein [Candidatus Moranbacteria bacterium]